MTAQDSPSTISDYLGALRRRRIYLLTIIPGGIFVAVFLAYALPAVYRSSATILLEPSSIPADLVQTTVTSYADEQIELVSRRVLTPRALEPVVAKFDPYPNETGLSARDKARLIIADTVIERVDPITFEVLKESSAFSIHYHNHDPELAAAVAQQIAELFLGDNRRSRSERAEGTYAFLRAQAQEVEGRIRSVDQEIAGFKSRHGAALPEAQVRNQAAAERASRDLMSIEAQMRAAEERAALLRVQLGRINPILGSTAGNVFAELALLQGQLADARVRYTADHPDVKRLERQIEALSARAAVEPRDSTMTANNPEFLSVKSQLDAAQRDIAALQASAARARQQIYEYEAGLSAAPDVEQEYLELVRNRDVLQKQFTDIQAKLREADIARNLETEQKGERFTQIRSPTAAKSPYSPNRLGIILLGIVLGAALAIGLAALVESMDVTVRNMQDLRKITAIPAIASVPLMLNAVAVRRRRLWWGAYAGALAIASAVAIVVARAA